MIDYIKLVGDIEPHTQTQIIEGYNLKQNLRDGGRTYYQTSRAQKNRQNLMVRVEDGRVVVECSLHKQYEQTQTGYYTNYHAFTLAQAQHQLHALLAAIGLDPHTVYIKHYEIGVNIYTTLDPLRYLERMRTTGLPGKEKRIYINPRFKDERTRVTAMHRDSRKIFKAYDKGFEAKDKRRRDMPPCNILRLEIVNRRIEKLSVAAFWDSYNIRRIFERFMFDWQTLKFAWVVDYGTPLKNQLATEIGRCGVEAYLDAVGAEYRCGQISRQKWRARRDFARNVYGRVGMYTQRQSKEEREFRECLGALRNTLAPP